MQHGPRNISTSQASWRKKKSQHPAICVQDWCTRIGTSTYWRTAPAFCVTNSTTKLKLLVGWLDPLTPGSVQRRAVTSSFFRGFGKHLVISEKFLWRMIQVHLGLSAQFLKKSWKVRSNVQLFICGQTVLKLYCLSCA